MQWVNIACRHGLWFRVRFVGVILTALLIAGLCAEESWAQNAGGALSLSGEEGWIKIPHSPSLSPTAQITIEMWVNPAVQPAGQQVPFLSKGLASGEYSYILECTALKKGWYSNFFLKNDDAFSGPSQTFPFLKWHHVAGVYDGNTIQIFVDGILRNTAKAQMEIPVYDSPLGIGHDVRYEQGYLKGEIDEVRIWNIARTQEQIQADMHRELTGDEEGLVAYYTFNETEGDVVHDLTANGNDGMLMGDAQIVPSTAPIGSGTEGWTVQIRLLKAPGNTKIAAGKVGIPAGHTVYFAATVSDEEGNEVDVPVTWGALGNAGTIDSEGQFTASTHAGDEGLVIATAGGAADTLSVKIVRGLLKRIEITPAEVVLKPGEQVTFQAQGYDLYGNAFKVNPFWYATRDIGTISTITGVFTAGDTPGTGDIVAFAWGVFGEVGTDVVGSAKVTVVSARPSAYRLVQNTPNPFNASTVIRYELPETGYVTLAIYDPLGRNVRMLERRIIPVGYHAVVWDGRDEGGERVGSGLYFCRLQVGKYIETRKMMMLR